MAQNIIMSQFYSCLNFPIFDRIKELTRIIDHSSPSKELQAFFPQLVDNIFSSTFNNGWGLRTTTFESNRMDFDLLVGFLEPLGPMFRLCYKLSLDPQLKYTIALNMLPPDLQKTLERGRCPHFYADALSMDPQGMHVVALLLNPFDYYILNFALHLISNTPNKSYWENWNSVYFALACDYLLHFLPADPNVTVLPEIHNYTGKVPMMAPMQTANRPLCSPSLLLMPDISQIANQHSPTQVQARNEIWRTETVLQVFIDIWMNVYNFESSVDLCQNQQSAFSSPERVRIVRVLVKHIHSYSSKQLDDPASRSSALRKYARQVMCARAYHYVKHLVSTWPLDASFRLVMELWLSLIQPWRYANVSINRDRFPGINNNQEEGRVIILDPSYTQFIAENYPAYTVIFQMILPRFMRLDLAAYKNAVMLFRLGKVFSQTHLVNILRELEQAITERTNGLYFNVETSWNNSSFDRNEYNNEMHTNKWVPVAKQAITELNMSTNFQYEPIWSEGRKRHAMEFLQKIAAAKVVADASLDEWNRKLQQQNQGTWASIKTWFMMGSEEDDIAFQESKKVPTYLAMALQQMTFIFGLSDNIITPPEVNETDNALEYSSSFANSSNFPEAIAKKLRSKTPDIRYMGDPELMPIATYESTFLVRILYQITSRINEVYQDRLSELWSRPDYIGYLAREVLQRPCTIRSYVKDNTYHQTIVSQNLPARLSLRRLGSYACIFWISLGYVVFRLFSYSGTFYMFVLFVLWASVVICKASLKRLNLCS